ncbi:hypothetical protein LY632_07115 [Erythrobacter sp. SDW2]|uniref:hypothetical protein n=1 Tax=Erythrobacter sp. SDW2 TaxID=2907154 RepID=UPI001F24DB4A|nr:hypothetical protein [Erythrobacter sp. SDW2]UIP08156.1 hypothetical protein LY632_07115 [Erythrobacter sp. SDW2]
MFNWAAMFAPVALLLPAVMTDSEGDARQLGSPEAATRPVSENELWTAFRPWETERLPQQVRIQQRVVIRISPARPRSGSIDEVPRVVPSRVVERKMGKCVAMNDIVAFQTGATNKLILFLRNRQMISAELEKACAARDFYSGFYVEPSKDGNLCIKREQLQSRNGTKCEIAKFARLEAARD